MDNDPQVISVYTDRQAVEDGVLVPVPAPGGVNRVTRTVFERYTQLLGESPITGPVTDCSRLMATIRTVLAVPADDQGWRVAKVDGQELWLVPNEMGGLTLMVPDDY